MLTNSCVKLQTVHSIPLTINKEGRLSSQGLLSLFAASTVCETMGFHPDRMCVLHRVCWPLPGVDGMGQGWSVPMTLCLVT